MVGPAIDKSQKTTADRRPHHWFKAQWYRPLGQFCELLSVLVLVALIGLFWLPPVFNWAIIGAIDFALATGLFCAAVLCLVRANRNSKQAADAFEEQTNSRCHVISDPRLLVLKEGKVPRDAFEVLKKLSNSRLSFENAYDGLLPDHVQTASGERILPAKQLIAELQKGLGRERTEEVKAVILKYTIQDEDGTDRILSQNPA